MHAAVSTANIDLLKSLLEEKKESVDVIEDKYKETPLHVACSKQKLACCKLLLEHNADPSIVNGNGDTPLHLLINAQEASIPIQERSELIEILLQHSAPINAKNNSGKSPIHIAASRGFTNSLIILSNQENCQLDEPDSNGLTPIVLAARNNRKDTVKVLLGLHISKDCLIQEAISGKLPSDIVKLVDTKHLYNLYDSAITAYSGKQGNLFKAIRSSNKQEVIKYWKKDKSVFKKKGPFNMSVIHVGALFGNEEILSYLLDKNKSMINQEADDKLTPLHVAAKEIRLKSCEILLKAKADPCVVDSENSTPLHALAEKSCNEDPISYHKVYKLLVEKGALMEARDSKGNTPVHIAAENGIEQAIVYLKPLGANINAVNSAGLFPIQLAARTNHPDIVATMMGLGSDISGLKNDYKYNILPNDVKKRFEVKLKGFPLTAQSSSYLQVGKKPAPSAPSSEQQASNISRRSKVSVSVGGEEHQILLLDQINDLISQGSDISNNIKKEYKSFIHKPGSHGQSPIHVAAMEGQSEALTLLLDTFDCNPNILDPVGRTPLLSACKYGRLDVIELLLERRLVNGRAATTINNRSALHYLASFPFADISRVASVIKRLIDKGLDITTKTLKQGYLPSHYASLSGNANTIFVLKFFGCSLSEQSSDGSTPIFLAAKNGNLEIVTALLESNISIDENTLKHIENHSFTKEIEDLLSTKPKLQDSTTNTQFEYNNEIIRIENFITREHEIHSHIIERDKIPELVKVVNAMGPYCLNIPSPTNGGISTHLAVVNGFQEIVTALVEKYHITLDRLDFNGNTCLHLSIKNGDSKMSELLLQLGANPLVHHKDGNILHLIGNAQDVFPNIREFVQSLVSYGVDVDELNSEGLSPLHIAAKNGNNQLISALLGNNASIDINSSLGTTPLHVAMTHSKKSSVRLLRSRGASVDWLHGSIESKFSPGILEVIKILQDPVTKSISSSTDDSPNSNDDPVQLFHSLTITGNKRELGKMIRKNPKLLHSLNHDTPLHLACASGNDIAVSTLLSHKIDCNTVNLFGSTPLMLAIDNNHSNIIQLLLEANAKIDLINNSIYNSPTKLSENTLDILEQFKVNLIIPGTTRERAATFLQTLQISLDKVYADNCSKSKEAKKTIHENLPEKVNIIPDSKLLSKKQISLLENAFNSFSISGEQPSKIDANGLQMVFTHFSISLIPGIDIDDLMKQISTTSTISFTEFLDIFASPISLFFPKFDDSFVEPENTTSVADSLKDRLENTLGGKSQKEKSFFTGKTAVLERVLNKQKPKGSNEKQDGESNDIRATHPPVTKSIPQRLPPPSAQILNTKRNSLPKQSDIAAQLNAIQLPGMDNFSGNNVRKLRSASISVHNPPKPNFIPREPSLTAIRSASIPTEELTSDTTNTPSPFVSSGSNAHQYFETIYDTLIEREGESLLSIDVFEEYFKDSFTSYNLLRTIVPTLMAQKDLEVPGISKEAFCDFYLSLKNRSLVATLETATSLRKQLNIGMGELLSSYSNLSSVERFKARMYLQQLSKIFGTMEETIKNTHCGLLSSKAHETSVLNDYDNTITELRSSMLSVHDTLNKLYAPRKIKEEKITDNIDEVLGNWKNGYSVASNTLLVIRTINVSSNNISNIREIIDCYVMKSSLIKDCSHAHMKFIEPSTFKITHCWTSPNAIESFMNSDTHKEYLESSKSLKLSEDVIVSKIS